MLTFDEIKKNEDIKTYIKRADESLIALGYTEHSFAHVTKVAETAAYILKIMGYPERDIELVKIAGYLHDIGNLINRIEHAQSGAVMAFRILDKMGFPAEEIATVATAIGNHDEGTAVPVNHIAAALILADKSDVRRSRVRNTNATVFDIHDRVNYSVTESSLSFNGEKNAFVLDLTIENEYCSVMDYFEIFLERMVLCRKAAEKLGVGFRLIINEQRLV
ncbi:MAG: HD domain-containing protein [Ruminococcaceae bacterium]|nr:HD domain-containing protein [Oscillospiraceae bacterium]